MSNSLQLDAFAKNSLNRLPTEIKEMIVAMVERQDLAYQIRRLTNERYGFTLADLSRQDFSDGRDLQNLVDDEYLVTVRGSDATEDERRKWRRLLGKGISSLFRVNREFAALAALHLFKTFYLSALANTQRADRGLLPQYRIQHFKALDLRRGTPHHQVSLHDSLAADIATRLPNARRLLLDYRFTTMLDSRPEHQLLTNEQYVMEKMVAIAGGVDSLVLQELPSYCHQRITQLFTGIASLDLEFDEDDQEAGIFTTLVHLLSELPCLRELRFVGSEGVEKDSTWRTVDSSEVPQRTMEEYQDVVSQLFDVPLERISWRMYQFNVLDLDFVHSFARTLRFLDIGIDDTSIILTLANEDPPVVLFPLLATLKISGSSPMRCGCFSLPRILAVFSASPITSLVINHSTLVDVLHGAALFESLDMWKKTLKSLTLDSSSPYRHSTHLPRLETFCEEFKIQLVLRGDYSVDALNFERINEEDDAEARELAALESKLSGLLELAMGENDRALALGDDRGLFELWNDCGGLMGQERLTEITE